jgi:hypothetical protein
MTATAKFYTVLVLVLAVIIGGSYYAGYRAGISAVRVAHHAPVAHPAP